MKLNKTLLFGLISAFVMATACSDDDDATKTPLTQPDPSEAASSVNSLSFNWPRVSNATQYGYQLAVRDGDVVTTGVTKGIEVVFTGLKPATTYILTVWAYASVNGTESTSKIAELTATTAATEQLATPGNLAASTVEGVTTVTWDAVANASSYTYTAFCSTDTVSGTVYTPTVELTGLRHLDYTFEVKANSSKAEYTVSSLAEFTFPVTAEVVWTNEGINKSLLLESEFTAMLTKFDDGVYKLSGWYGVDGYDLVFTVSDGGFVVPFGDYEETSEKVWKIPTGLSALPYVQLSTLSGRESTFSGDKDNGGVIRFCTTSYSGVADTFTWESNYYELYRVDGKFTCGETGSTYDATLVVYDNNTASLRPWVGVEGYNLDFVFNESGIVTEITSGYDYYEDGTLFWAYTGLESPSYLYIRTNKDRCYLIGNRKQGKLVLSEGLNAYYNDTFTWDYGDITIDDFVGTYSYVTTGQEYVTDFTNWYNFSYEGTYNVAKTSDGKLVFDNFYWSGYPFEGTLDVGNLTITFQPQEMGWYIFAGDESPTTPVVGRISPSLNTITFEDWNGWYGDYTYFGETKTVFSR